MATAQKLLFATGGETFAQHTLWVTDGTTDGTYSLIASTSSSYADAEAGNFGGSPDFGILSNRVFFATSDTTHGEELWVTNGTTAGTSLLKDINPGTAGSAPNSFVAISSSELLFSADDGTDGPQLWITNGTTGGTSMLKDIYPGGNSLADYFTPFKGGALFSADDGTHGGEVWYTDGTTAGTSMLKDINPGAASSGFFSPAGPRYFLSLGSEAVFIANDGTHGLEPWVTDGTTAGTSLLKDINPGSASSSGHLYSDTLTLFNGEALFQANDGTHGYELWVTDGTTADTSMVKDINPGSGSSYPEALKVLGDEVLFAASDGVHGTELWVTNGTAAGTSMVKDINPGGSSDPYHLALFNGKVLFAANDGTDGTELWVTDGTSAGTSMVKDINPGAGSSNPYDLTVFGNEVLFDANDGTHGYELWVTDGTTAGTSLFADIAPGSASSYARPVAELSILCFVSGTRIATPAREVPVEQLAVGDKVLTLRGEARRIIWIGGGRVLATRGRRNAATPVIVRRSALADNVPHGELRVTKGHSLYIDNVLIPVEFLVNHRSILWDDRAQEVSLYHIELETHDVLLANGAPAESYRDDGNRWLFQNANSGWDLPPQEPCAPVLTGGPVVDAIWSRLLERAGPRKKPPLTEDADLHVLIDGRRLDAAARIGEAHIFHLPAAPSTLRIVSRATAPAELGLARDPRVLGVALRRLVVREGTRFRLVEAKDNRLTDGFHAFEADNGFRWTDGDAAIPTQLYAGFTAPLELVLHIGATARYFADGPVQHVA